MSSAGSMRCACSEGDVLRPAKADDKNRLLNTVQTLKTLPALLGTRLNFFILFFFQARTSTTLLFLPTGRRSMAHRHGVANGQTLALERGVRS